MFVNEILDRKKNYASKQGLKQSIICIKEFEEGALELLNLFYFWSPKIVN